ncbi:MAG: SusC/RagA family TonB-linked outer membrane protein [Bacteroides sp.]|jgi:TonB-linked SusC/RagA family outer membrane protein|nr:SusC/RagA family TonB-linked outer membrane protein [Bacteroides sp.]
MKGKLTVLIFLAGIFLSLQGYGQERTVSGRILDESGLPMIGATVIVEGTQDTGLIGATANLDGDFSITLPAGRNQITVSFTGYRSQTINVEGLDYIEVILVPAVDVLEEFVVTALGIKREEKALGYAVTSVNSEDIQNMSRVNPINSLAGLAPGLQISSSGSGAGGSTKILIRGVSSLTGSNDPLIVVDGVPVSSGGGAGGTQFGGFDYGSAINNISLDDIENISVLKGGAASALYGSRGQNGVIMITTKSGQRQEGIGISYMSSFSVDNPLIAPDFQNAYSQGSSRTFERLGTRSWGPKMEGQDVTNFLKQPQTLAINNQSPYSFFRQASNFDQTISIDKRGETNAIFFSASWNQNNGIIPTNDFDRKSFNLRYESNLSKFISFDARVNYINQEVHNRPNLAGSPDNPVYLLVSMPRSVMLEQLEPYQTVDGYPVVWNSKYRMNPDGTVAWDEGKPPFASSPLLQNPFWAVELNTNRDLRHRFIGFSEMRVDFQEWLGLNFDLDFKLRAGMDFYNDDRQRITAHNTYYKAEGRATGTFSRSEGLERNYEMLISFGKKWGDFSALASAGANLMHFTSRSISSNSEAGLINPDGPYVIQNFLTVGSSQGYGRREIQSVYGLVSTDWKRMVFLDLTFRNDWTSVLAPDNWSYFFPSVSASWLLEETFDLPRWIDLLKLRASWAGVGNGGNFSSPRYFQFGTNPNQYLGLPYGFLNSVRPNYELLPEYTVSKEVGLQTVMLGSRFNFDISWYELGTRDQIFQSPLAPSSGYNSGIINSGYIKNSGIEMQTGYQFKFNNGLTWNISGNVTRQWNEVTELSEEVNFLNLGGIQQGVYIAARYGQPVGQIMGTAFDRDEEGRIILDALNLPRIKTTPEGAIDTENLIGNAYPDLLLGFSTSLNYKSISLGVQLDSKLGHDLYSLTNLRGAEYGTFAFTVEGRDEWQRALEISEITGVPPTDGFMVSGVKDGVEGEFPVDPQSYWDRLTRIDEAFVYDASYIRLRSVSLSYSVNPDLLSSFGARELSISVYANNLAYLYKKTENISPESSFSTGNAIGIEMYSYPELRTLGASIKVSF